MGVVACRGERTGMAGSGRLALWAVCVSCVLGVENEGDDPLDWLRSSIPGEPGTDYPIMATTQDSGFSCDGLVFGGYYADPATECQQYSVCLQDPISPDTLYPVNFLCPTAPSSTSSSSTATGGSTWTARHLRASMVEPREHLELQEAQEEERTQVLVQQFLLDLLMSALEQSPPAGVLDRGTLTALETGSAV